jgi:hypothetical protein
MNKLRFTFHFFSALVALSCLYSAANAQGPSSKYYEVRVYHPTPGKYDAIVDRFRQYTTKLFEKHGMENIGYWTPTDTSRKELVYILAYPSKAARDTSWKKFGSDPAWREVVAKTEANGKLVSKVDSYFMTESDLSPVIKPTKKSPVRAFELRTYTAQPGKLPNLLTRFRDHTRTLFTKHGMENVAYWVTSEKEGEQAKLVYILAHPSEETGKANFEVFRKDSKWMKVKADSEKDGPLTVKVESLYLKPTDYSPMQ